MNFELKNHFPQGFRNYWDHYIRLLDFENSLIAIKNNIQSKTWTLDANNKSLYGKMLEY